MQPWHYPSTIRPRLGDGAPRLRIITILGLAAVWVAVTVAITAHGIYGAWGGRGLIAYALGFCATLPFFVLPDIYTGPAARALGGVDIGWLVGLIVSGGVYRILSRSLNVSTNRERLPKARMHCGAPLPRLRDSAQTLE